MKHIQLIKHSYKVNVSFYLHELVGTALPQEDSLSTTLTELGSQVS